MWIPISNSESLRMRILVAAHNGIGGHGCITPSYDAIKRHFSWKPLKTDVEAFCRSCLHCLLNEAGEKIPRLLGHSINGELPNEVLHLDFSHIRRSSSGEVYILILKDDFSSYVWPFLCVAADAEATADCFIEWFSSFGTVKQWESDRGSHFRKQLVREIRERMHFAHHVTLAYCPRTNGSVEVVCRDLLREMKALLSEFRMTFKMSPAVVPIVESILNRTQLARINGLCPLTTLTQLPAD